jgi:hypothetical protein
MDSREFVGLIKEVVRDAAISDTVSVLERPPGRRPPQVLTQQAAWYQSLDEQQKKLLKETIANGVDKAIFGLFCVLDGVRAIEGGPNKGIFELRYVKEKSILLNPPEGTMLHDVYNAG